MAPHLPLFSGNLWLIAALCKRVAAALFVACALCVPPSIAQAKKFVHYETDAGPGTIVIEAARRKLFFILGGGRAIAYPVGVPRHGAEWSGETYVNGKYVRPAWAPTPEIKEEEPWLPDEINGGASNNPMGARAITLERSEVAIHGSTRRMRATIGGAASHGCIRMYNEDVIDLYKRVHIGTPVLMLP